MSEKICLIKYESGFKRLFDIDFDAGNVLGEERAKKDINIVGYVKYVPKLFNPDRRIILCTHNQELYFGVDQSIFKVLTINVMIEKSGFIKYKVEIEVNNEVVYSDFLIKVGESDPKLLEDDFFDFIMNESNSKNFISNFVSQWDEINKSMKK